jgi:hypothetical protein
LEGSPSSPGKPCVRGQGKAVGCVPPTALLFEQPRYPADGKDLEGVAGLFVATQYEIPFKLSISTFQVSIMVITPAIASHKVRHPSW